MKNETKVIAVDFDGTLCENKYPDIGRPNMRLIDWLNYRKIHECAKIILWTCRENEYLDEALEACSKWGLTFDAVNANLPERIEQFGTDPRKIGADEYVDDRNVYPLITCLRPSKY